MMYVKHALTAEWIPETVDGITPSVPVFNSEWRKACSVTPARISDVDRFIQAHYLKKRPAVVLLSLQMLCNGIPMGCIVFSAPPREVDKRYGGTTWELARLYLLDEVPRNAESWLVSKAVKYIKKHHKQVAYLVSYADPSVGHKGVVYRAANWRSDGRTDDERKSPRCDYVDLRTGKKYGRKGNMPKDAIVGRMPRVSKFRFFIALRGE
jgi:hypothetical protein